MGFCKKIEIRLQALEQFDWRFWLKFPVEGISGSVF
jgi:hypothetical protein